MEKNHLSLGVWLHMKYGVEAKVMGTKGLDWVQIDSSSGTMYLITRSKKDAEELAALLEKLGKPEEER